MFRVWRQFVASSAAVWVVAQVAFAATPSNNTSPGRLTEFDITVETIRHRTGPLERSELQFAQSARLVQYVLEGTGGKARQLQLLRVDGCTVKSLKNRDEAAVELPAPQTLGLDAGGVYVNVTEYSAEHAALLSTGWGGEERIGIEAALAQPQWPSRMPAAGKPWTMQVQLDDVSLRHEWSVIAGSDDGEHAVFEGELASGPLSAPGSRLRYATTELTWDRATGTPVKIVGAARFRVRHATVDDEYEVSVKLQRARNEQLDAKAQQTMLKSIRALTDVVSAADGGDTETAGQLARDYVKTYPSSPWRPVVEHLLDEAQPADPAPEPKTLPDVKGDQEKFEALAARMAAWQSADRAGDAATRAALRSWFTQRVSAWRSLVDDLLIHDEPGPRSVGVFALGFSTEAMDLITLEKATGDADARIRTWATYALTIRADKDTQFATLRMLSSDEDARVRAQACQAIAVCVPADAPDAIDARAALIKRLSDDADGVRLQAAMALAHFAKPADREKIQTALSAEPVPVIRDALDRLLEMLEEQRRR